MTNTVDINAIILLFQRDTRTKEAANLDEDILPSGSILGPINTAQSIFGANGIMQKITISAN